MVAGQLARAVNARQVEVRQREMERETVIKYYDQQRNLDTYVRGCEKDDAKRKEREVLERRQQHEMIETLENAERLKVYNGIKSEEDGRIAAAMAAKAREEDRHQRELQRMLANADELRTLEAKVRAARMNATRAKQVEEKRQLSANNLQYDLALDEITIRNLEAARAKEAAAKAARKARNIAQRHFLEGQMEQRQALNEEAAAEYKRERAMVDEVVRRILEEIAGSAAARQAKVDETKAFIASYLAAKEERLARERAEEDAAEASRQAYQQTIVERERAAQVANDDRKAAADAIYEQLRQAQEAREALRAEDEQILSTLHFEEREAAYRAKEAAQRAKAEALRAELKKAMYDAQDAKAARIAAQAAEEAEFAGRLLAQWAEEDRIEMMNAQKRRMRQQEHRRAIDKMLEEKRACFEAAIVAEEAEQAQLRAAAEYELSVIEEARRALLAEAASLKQYLPKFVARDEEEYKFINDMSERFQRLKH